MKSYRVWKKFQQQERDGRDVEAFDSISAAQAQARADVASGAIGRDERTTYYVRVDSSIVDTVVIVPRTVYEVAQFERGDR